LEKTRKDIHLVRAAFYKQFTKTMQNNGINPAKYYRRVGLPTTEPENPESLLPEKPFWQLVNMVAMDENIPNFGAQVATAFPWHNVVSLGPLIRQSKTLSELIVTFCKISSSQSSHVKFDLESFNGCHWFASKGTPLVRKDIQMELYRVTCMIQLIQLATGSAWRPENIQLAMPTFNPMDSCSLIKHSTINFSCGQTAIEIPDIALNLPVRFEIPDNLVNLNDYDIDANFINSLKLILEIYIIHGEGKIGVISKAIGIPVRTLQRRLKTLETSFNELLGETRFELAKVKLKSGTWSTQRVSRELGYSDDAHFVRAFKRWSGKTPGGFRIICRR
jgi:AraC-like DNA-binding protein